MAEGTRFKLTEKMESQLNQLQQIATMTRDTLMHTIQKQDEQGRLLQDRKQTILDMKRSTEEWQTRMDQSMTRMDQTMTQMGEWMRALSQEVDRQFNLEETPILAMGNRWPWRMDASFGVVNGNQIGFLIVDERFSIDDGERQSELEGIDATSQEWQDKNQFTKSSDHGGQPENSGTQIVRDSPRITDLELEFNIISESVLGNSEAIWIDDDVVESSTADEIATPIEDIYQEIDEISKDLRFPTQCESSRAEGLPQPSNPEYEDSIDGLQIVSDESEVNLKSRALNELDELVNLLIELMELRLANSRKVGRTDSSTNPVGCLGNFSACKVFVEMPSSIGVDCCLDFDSFEPKPVSFDKKIKPNIRNWPYDRGKFDISSRGMRTAMAKVGHSLRDRHLVLGLVGNDLKSLPFDRGWIVVNRVAAHRILSCMMTFDPSGCDPAIGRSQRTLNRCGAERMGMYWLSDCILTFDPGGVGFREQEAAIGSCKLLLLP